MIWLRLGGFVLLIVGIIIWVLTPPFAPPPTPNGDIDDDDFLP